MTDLKNILSLIMLLNKYNFYIQSDEYGMEKFLQYSIIENSMSKNKPKDKKNDATALIQKQYEAQKRDVIDYEFTIKKLEQRLAQKVFENEQLAKQLEQVHLVDKEKIKILTERTEDDEKRLTNQINRITELEINATRYESLIKSLNQELLAQKQGRQKQASEFKIRLQNQRTKYKFELQTLQLYAQNREKTEQELLNLREKVEYEKSQKIRELADKQREKVQATDKLRDEMLKKIRQMKTNLLSLKKQQLSTTTRLTILQNHQLTSQLEYQSKQTEKLIFKEEEMYEKIKHLTQQLAIHKQVQEQLAKRAHFSKGVIKKLNDRVAQLEKQLQIAKNPRNVESGKNLTYTHKSASKSNLLFEAQTEQNGKQCLAEIEKQLEQTEKKFLQAQSKYFATEKERDSLVNQLKKYENSCNDLAKLLISYLDQITNSEKGSKINEEISDSVLKVDLEILRNKKIEEWSSQQTQFVVKVLLSLIKPYLNKKNVMIPTIRRLLVIEDGKLGKSQSKLPKLLNEQDQNDAKGLKDLPINIASKIVGSNLRQWGTTVKLNQNAMLRKKYKITQSHR